MPGLLQGQLCDLPEERAVNAEPRGDCLLMETRCLLTTNPWPPVMGLGDCQFIPPLRVLQKKWSYGETHNSPWTGEPCPSRSLLTQRTDPFHQRDSAQHTGTEMDPILTPCPPDKPILCRVRLLRATDFPPLRTDQVKRLRGLPPRSLVFIMMGVNVRVMFNPFKEQYWACAPHLT